MNNEEIADALKLTAQLMELHNENQFKVKSLLAASFRIDKLDRELEQVPFEELESIDGIGKSLASKIQELNTIGTTKELQALLEKTPIGVIEMLGIKGIGPKKVQLLWKQLELETVGELLYACNENRLVDLKGFGEKTQELVRKAIEYKLASNGFYHFAKAEIVALQLMDFLQKKYAPRHLSITGSLRRKCELVEKIEILTTVLSVDISEFINDAGD